MSSDATENVRPFPAAFNPAPYFAIFLAEADQLSEFLTLLPRRADRERVHQYLARLAIVLNSLDSTERLEELRDHVQRHVESLGQSVAPARRGPRPLR